MTKRQPLKFILMITMLLSLAFTIIVYAEPNMPEEEQTMLEETPVRNAPEGDTASIITGDTKGALFIDYKDTVDGTDAIVGAEFTIYRIADMKFFGNFESLIPGLDIADNLVDEEEALEKAQTAYASGSVTDGYKESVVTGTGGAIIQSIPLGLYIVEESKPADNHNATDPFFLSVPYTNAEGTEWLYDVTVQPKPLPTANLEVYKEVSGDGADKTKQFHFKVVLTGCETEPFTVETTGGSKGPFKSGESLALRHGERATIYGIPVGTAYTVTEEEANQDGYVTSADHTEGNIKRTEKNVVSFFNARRNSVDTGDTYLPIICGVVALLSMIMMVLLLDGIKKINRKLRNQ